MDNAHFPFLDPVAVTSFKEAIKDLEDHTCLRFRPKATGDSHHIILTSMGGCWSYVGRQDDRPDGQELSLSPLCWEKSTIQHEIMHALGFFHEHSRFDRDKFITINLANVEKSKIFLSVWLINLSVTWSIFQSIGTSLIKEARTKRIY